ncbi:recombinase family protein [Aminobacter sp. MDW-2]|jgi:DNA invertase Pin-like site-specific DNA recombinase|uniref:DNA invertase Pin-like site-specific DNA recombinase n=1 Tax=Aminobacter aminovorans TaxID=83263 RepID=A0AAC8YTA6_AMIAI|nr:Site-specific recombinase, DNA invertase Pin [Aminobacter aminovorans]MBB3705458.1 DNA invertase Pin-like site-specific DNA recombinase [Aminobacter aminovorans]MRX33828.1 helix-turn-helix domain-containing protein [Aminobacter sp. MDW-2]QNH34132.1 recombinase family protein [Aminobacter sp. MDW-2]
MGQLVLTVLGMAAQMERRFIKERQREGIDKAKAAGVYQGSKPRIDRATICEMHAEGVGATAIAKAVGCSRMQVYRVLRASPAG